MPISYMNCVYYVFYIAKKLVTAIKEQKNCIRMYFYLVVLSILVLSHLEN